MRSPGVLKGGLAAGFAVALEVTAALAMAIGALEIAGRRRAVRWRGFWQDVPEDEPSTVTVLDIGRVTSAHTQTLTQESHERASPEGGGQAFG